MRKTSTLLKTCRTETYKNSRVVRLWKATSGRILMLFVERYLSVVSRGRDRQIRGARLARDNFLLPST